MRTALLLITTAAMALTLAVAGFTSVSHKAKPANTTSLIAKGKKLSVLRNCTSCHGKDLKGKPQFSPSLHASGPVRHYTQKTFEGVMNNGTTDDGGHVKPPMPVFKMSAADSDALYAYFKSLK